MTILSAALILFLVIDPIGNIPVFLFVLKDVDYVRRRSIIIRELCIALIFLIVFLFSGRYILTIMQISQSSLSISGGIILFLIAIRMIFSGAEERFGYKLEGEPLIVPLAVPLIAGPSAMATVLLLMAREPSRWPAWLAALMSAWFVSGIILLFSNTLSKYVSDKVLTAIETLMGLILTTVAIEMFIAGVKQTFLQ